MRYRYGILAAGMLLGASFAFGANRFPPAPDDLMDPDLIDLDLDAIVAEGEPLWSFQFSAGLGQKNLSDTEKQAASIASIETMFNAVNAQIGEVADIGWSGDGFSDLTVAFNWRAGARYKFPETVGFPLIGGRFAFEFAAGRVGSSMRLSERGFGATLTDQAYFGSGNMLFFLPREMTRGDFPILGSKRDVFVSAGLGYARGIHQIELFIPPRDFSSIPPPTLLEASQWKPMWQISVGGEEFYTSFFSLSWQVGYQYMQFDRLEYNDASIATLRAAETKEPIAEPIVIGYTDVASVWTPFSPPEFIYGSYGADPSNPIDVVFTGLTFSAGFRYHF